MWQDIIAIGYIYILTRVDPRASRLCHINFVEYLWDVCVVCSITRDLYICCRFNSFSNNLVANDEH